MDEHPAAGGAKAESPLRTLHLNTERTWRGGEQQTLYLIKGLLERGHAADVVCQPGSPMALRARALDRNVTVHEIRMRGEVSPAAALRIARAVRRGPYDIVHAHTSHAHSLGLLALAFARGPRLVVSRRVDFSIFRRSFLGLNLLKYRYGVDRYIAVSSAIRSVLVRDGVPARMIEVVRSGVDTARFPELVHPPPMPPDIPGGGPWIGNVGHLTPHKGQAFLIQAMPRVLDAVPAARALIVGEGELRDQLTFRARELGLSDKVILTGFRRDIGAILANLSLFVMPSTEEGLGTAVLDALLFGLPVVGTSAGGIPEVIVDGETGLVVPPGDPDALATAMIRMLSRPDEAAEYGRRGRERVLREFSVASMVEGTLRVYREVLEAGASG